MDQNSTEKSHDALKPSTRADGKSNDIEGEYHVDAAKEMKPLAKLDLAFTPIIMCLFVPLFNLPII